MLIYQKRFYWKCKVVVRHNSNINVDDVPNTLLVTFQVANIAGIPLTPQESELYNALKNAIIKALQESMFYFKDVTGLQFERSTE